ncbi:MAG TPA: HlyD family efflux transporter periplasmic adaptor subunit, partial [Alphaproteobacteria bacterium]|nr:HlyD family efflux transporter periplasmic adaptor subunit [Alphaproteobacteria bacterium]
LRYKTTGGVIGPGEEILDVVPKDDELVIDARVSPVDIDTVHAGLEAQIHLTAYRQRNLPRISGTVQTVSADALTDESTGESYFLAQVQVDADQLQSVAPNIELKPGMPAEVMIVTGERTALDYFITPFLESLNRAFRES